MVFTVNQLVAMNLIAARSGKGWKQAEAAEALEPYLGTRWSKASYSAAERSFMNPKRIRQFTADELLAFAAAFDVPVQFFFRPPTPGEGTEVGVTAGSTPGSRELPLADYLRIAFGSEDSVRDLERSLTDVFASLPEGTDDATLSDLRRTLRSTVTAKMYASKRQLEKWDDALSGIQELLQAAIDDALGEEVGRRIHSVEGGEERPVESLLEDEDEPESEDAP